MGLHATGMWYNVPIVTLQPSMWFGGGFDHHGKSVFFVVEGAKDNVASMNAMHGGLALFPEQLRSELHEVRATIEAHSKKGRLEVPAEPMAIGLKCESGRSWSVYLRVTDKLGNISHYLLDRWD